MKMLTGLAAVLLLLLMLLELRTLLVVQVWLQRGMRCTYQTSGRPGRRSNRLKRIQSSPPFLRMPREGWRWGRFLFLPSRVPDVRFIKLMKINEDDICFCSLCALSPEREHILEQHWMSRFSGFPLGSQVHVYPFAVFLQQVGKSSDICVNPCFATCLLISNIELRVCPVFYLRVKKFRRFSQ